MSVVSVVGGGGSFLEVSGASDSERSEILNRAMKRRRGRLVKKQGWEYGRGDATRETYRDECVGGDEWGSGRRSQTYH